MGGHRWAAWPQQDPPLRSGSGCRDRRRWWDRPQQHDMSPSRCTDADWHVVQKMGGGRRASRRRRHLPRPRNGPSPGCSRSARDPRSRNDSQRRPVAPASRGPSSRSVCRASVRRSSSHPLCDQPAASLSLATNRAPTYSPKGRGHTLISVKHERVSIPKLEGSPDAFAIGSTTAIERSCRSVQTRGRCTRPIRRCRSAQR